MAASPICTIMRRRGGTGKASMAASPICTIMRRRGGTGKCVYGSVPHLYDNGVQEGLERLLWQRPPFVR